uniref:DUF2442 domain-containing protein n=1 Tax=Schlesneria paludicola TaxID=360056 RepID=A0A7C2NWZ5_9PLAN
MTTSVTPKKAFRRAFRPTSARAVSVECDDLFLIVTLEDGRVVQAPLDWFPLLSEATPEQRSRCEIAGNGTSLHWPEIDEDLTVANLLAGGDVEST